MTSLKILKQKVTAKRSCMDEKRAMAKRFEEVWKRFDNDALSRWEKKGLRGRKDEFLDALQFTCYNFRDKREEFDLLDKTVQELNKDWRDDALQTLKDDVFLTIARAKSLVRDVVWEINQLGYD